MRNDKRNVSDPFGNEVESQADRVRYGEWIENAAKQVNWRQAA
jgi:hypothetical protein